jgi:hypothetical protein
MCGIDRQPVLRGVRTALGMCAFAPPIFVAHKLEQLRRGGPGAAERIKGGSHLAIVVIQTFRIDLLIIALNNWMIFNQEAPESDAAGSFTVGEMMNNLDRTPFPLDGMSGQKFSRKTFKATETSL